MIIEFGNRYFYWNEEKTKSAFYEASDRKHTVIRWVVIVLLIAMGVGILASNLDELRAYEQAAREPILVEADITIVENGWWDEHYTAFLSYTYEGVDYEGVPYWSHQHLDLVQRLGDTVTVALDPRDHGQLVKNMLKTGRINAAIVMLSIGLGLLAYFHALRNEIFRRRREEKAARYSWNKGRPDYILDSALFVAPILVLALLGMGIIFPAAFGMGPFITTALLAVLGSALYFTVKPFRK